MKIIGLFIVVFGIAFIDKLVGFSEMASVVGIVMGAGSYILLSLSN